MNSQSGKNSFEDMKDMMRQAQTPQTCAVITEENWESLISLLAHQILDNATATRHTSDNDYNRTDGRIDKQSRQRIVTNLPREAGFNNGEAQQSYESDRVGFQQVSHKTGQRTEGRNQENDAGDILTGWENERRFFEQSFYGERAYERYTAQTKDNQLGTDSNASLITWSINFMGNFADLLNTNNRSYRRKRIKLSKKSIRKRQAKGQKTSGYEEYDDYDYTMSM